MLKSFLFFFVTNDTEHQLVFFPIEIAQCYKTNYVRNLQTFILS